MIRRPPKSTLFPSRRSSDLKCAMKQKWSSAAVAQKMNPYRFLPRLKAHMMVRSSSRSEEHTSELQSQSNLVCRLLLEKKKHNKFKQHMVSPNLVGSTISITQ